MVNRATNSHLTSNHLTIQTMHLEIITPDRKVFAGEVTSAQFPGSDGLFEVLNNHAPLISALKAGAIVVTSGSGREAFQIEGGVVEVLRNNVTVLAEGVAA
jgi:F-type H+-transporting ATPase subunit epsilon